MSIAAPAQPATASGRWHVRLWPALVILAAAGVLIVVPGQVLPRTMVHFISQFGGPALCGLAIALWWAAGACAARLGPLPDSRAAVRARRGHGRHALPRLPNGRRHLLPAGRRRAQRRLAGRDRALPRGPRRAGLVLVMLSGWAAAGMVRAEGIDGDLTPDLHWRWQPTAEARFLAERKEPNAPAAAVELYAAPGDWAGFRGPDRDSRVAGVAVDTGLGGAPAGVGLEAPRRAGVGFVRVVGDRLFTQEQHGPDEAVVCYAANTGDEIWSVSGAGAVRGVHGRRRAAGDADVPRRKALRPGGDGQASLPRRWDRHTVWVADVTDGPGGIVPQWGYPASPLVIQGLVVVYAGGPDGKGTAAFKADTGTLAWAPGQASHCYTSAHRAVLRRRRADAHGQRLRDRGVPPADGAVLWEHAWPMAKGMNRVPQPVVSATPTCCSHRRGQRPGRPPAAGDEGRGSLGREGGLEHPRGAAVLQRRRRPQGPLLRLRRRTLLLRGPGDRQSRPGRRGQYGHGQVLLLADQGLLAGAGRERVRGAGGGEPGRLQRGCASSRRWTARRGTTRSSPTAGCTSETVRKPRATS